MTYDVVFSPEANDQLVSLYHYIAEEASPQIALQYTEAGSSHYKLQEARSYCL